MRPEYAVVSPEFGIAEGATLLPPNEGLPLWLAAVSLRQDVPAGGSYSASVVGAAGLSRGNAWVRGVGEAVERYALAPAVGTEIGPSPGLPEVTDELATHGVVGDLPPGGPTYPATRLATGEPSAVPRVAVDYPGAGLGDKADQTPSGAASALGRDRALVRATLELVERDAFERAWQGITTPHRVDLVEVASTADPDARAHLDALGTILRDHGATARMGILPTITGVPAVTALVQRGDGPVGVGCSVGASVAACAVKAIVEGLQVESLLTNWRAQPGADAPDSVDRPRTEADRIEYLGTPAATRAAADFADAFTDRPVAGLVAPPDTSAALAAQLAGLGVQLFAVDLTGRLPEPVRALGWNAVRVLPAGLQPLRGNDRLTWNWAPLRVPGRAHAAGEPPRPPHPLA